MRFHNFDLWIDEKDKASLVYHLRANIETFDSASGLMHIDPASAQVNEIMERFAQRDIDRQFLTEAGTLLYQAIFQTEEHRLYDLFQRCLGRYLPTANDGIRLRLRIEAPEIAALPWEFLYLPGNNVFLSTWIRTPLVRYLEVARPVPKLEISPPIQLLGVIPHYHDLPNLDIVKEKNLLLRSLEGMQSYVKPTFLEGKVSLDQVEDTLNKNEFHILHFIGHGDFGGDEGVLCLTMETLNQEQLGNLFQNLEHMKLIVLNACKGAQVSQTNLFLGIAPQLVKQGVPAVVAMQYSIYDDVAVHFCRQFYKSLFKGKYRGKVDLALTQARNSLHVKYPEERAFGAPVLFLRSPKGVLFHRSLPRTILGILSKIPHLLAATNEAHRLEDAAYTYIHNKDVIEDSDIDAQTKASRVQDAEERIKQIYKLLKYQSLAAAAVVAFIMFCMFWVNLFDLAHLDTRMESYTMALGDFFMHKQFSDNIVMIPIDEKVEEQLGENFGVSWRGDYARLTTNLSRAGAKVIVFSIYFEGDSRKVDDEFGQSIIQARHRGTSVIVGVGKYDKGEPALPKELKSAVSGWGSVVIGTRGYAKLFPLVIRKETKPNNVNYVPGLALRAFAAYKGTDKVEIVDFDPNQTQIIVRFNSAEAETVKLHFFESENIDKDQASDPNDILDYGDVSAEMVIDKTPLSVIRDESRRYSFVDIIEHPEPETLTQFQNKIVMVGVAIERLRILSGNRWPFEIQADAINTLFSGVAIRSVAPSEQLVLMVILGILGATIRARTRHVSRRLGISLLIAVLLAYFAFTIYLYVQYRLLLNTAYHAIALLLTYWVVGKIERRYFKWELRSLISRGGLGG